MDKLGHVREPLGLCRAGGGHRPVICVLRREMGRPILVLDHEPLVMRRFATIPAAELAAANEIASLDAAITSLLHIRRPWRGASEFHR